MALLELNAIAPHEERNRIVRILSYKRNDDANFTLYVIQVHVGDYTWTVERRFRDFAEFDSKRFKDQKRSFLPPKKLVGNSDPNFLAERRSELEKYLRTVVELELWLQKKRNGFAMPRLLARFLDFHQYEVHAIADDLAERLAKQGDKWLHASTSKPKYFEFTPIEFYALTERLKLAVPTAASSDASSDVGHAVEFLHKVANVKIRGARGYVGTSNIVWNSLPFSLQYCKSMLALWMTDCDATMISGLSNVKRTVKCLVAHYTLERLSHLLADADSSLPFLDQQRWSSIQDVDLSFNKIAELDESLILLDRVERLNLSHNCLADIGSNLQHLTNLTELNLGFNGIENIDDWHTKLGNLKRLVLTGNSIRSLKGLRKLYSLQYLDLKDNSLTQVADIWSVGRLPCLDTLILTGNPVEAIVEYRTRVLEAFGMRAGEVHLDHERASQKELDTVSVRLAIRKAKDEKEAMVERTRMQIGEKLKFLSGDESFADECTIGASLGNDTTQ